MLRRLPLPQHRARSLGGWPTPKLFLSAVLLLECERQHPSPVLLGTGPLGIAWRQSNARVISVAQRDAVAALDTFVGPKS